MEKIKIKAWFFIFRPWSFTATAIPFLVSLALVPPTHGIARWWTGLLSGILFQATVNLLNTWGDERSGVDRVPGAICTTPQVQQGLISMRALLAVALLCAASAATLGLALCFYWDGDGLKVSVPLLVAGFVGLLGSTNYSTGIKFKYRGLGVPFVAFLMGPLEIFVAMCILHPSDAASPTTPSSPYPTAISIPRPSSIRSFAARSLRHLRSTPSRRQYFWLVPKSMQSLVGQCRYTSEL